MADSEEKKCGFCAQPSSKVQKLVKGITDVHICNMCVTDAFDIIEEHMAEEAKAGPKGKKGKFNKPTPKEILAHLDQYVIGQTQAKKTLAVSVYNHYKRIGKKTTTDMNKSNVILVGPTGSGKTHILETIAKFLEVPFASADATGMTEAGYVGDDVDSVLVRLVQSAGGDIEKAEMGICYIDEIDKIASRESRGRDVSGEGVQQGLLKILEGTIVNINPNGKKTSQSSTESINTKNILFIVGGAFSAISDPEDQVEKQLGIAPPEPKVNKPQKIVKHKDLVKFGMIPEFVGRFPLIAQLSHLTEQDLVKILTEPKNSIIKQYKELLSIDGVELDFNQEFLDEVAKRAKGEGTGARGLKAIVEPLLLELMLDAPDLKEKKVEITKDIFEKELK